MPWHMLNIAAHVAAGVLALLIGLMPLVSAKGGAWHRRSGRWFACFAAVGLCTAIIGDLFFQPALWLAAVTLAFGYDLIAGMRAQAIRRTGPGLLDAALAAAALAAAAWLAMQASDGGANGIIVRPTVSFTAAIAVYDLSRHLWRQSWRTRIWPLDHGLKMTAAYFAMASAGAGNLLRGLQPFSQLAPSLLGTLVMTGFALYFLLGAGRDRFGAMLNPGSKL